MGAATSQADKTEQRSGAEQERQRRTEHENVSQCRTVEDGRERLEADEGRFRGKGEELSPGPGDPATEGARAALLWHLSGVCGEVYLQGASTVVTQKRLRWVRDPPPVFIYYSNPTLSDTRCINNANVPFLRGHCQI